MHFKCLLKGFRVKFQLLFYCLKESETAKKREGKRKFIENPFKMGLLQGIIGVLLFAYKSNE